MRNRTYRSDAPGAFSVLPRPTSSLIDASFSNDHFIPSLPNAIRFSYCALSHFGSPSHLSPP